GAGEWDEARHTQTSRKTADTSQARDGGCPSSAHVDDVAGVRRRAPSTKLGSKSSAIDKTCPELVRRRRARGDAGIAKLGSQRTVLSPHDTFTPRFSFPLLPPSHTALALVASDVVGWIVDRKWNGRVVSTVGYC